MWRNNENRQRNQRKMAIMAWRIGVNGSVMKLAYRREAAKASKQKWLAKIMA